MPANLQVTVDYPEKRLTSGTQVFVNILEHNQRVDEYSNVMLEHYSGSLMLTPHYLPSVFRADKSSWDFSDDASFIDTHSPFGDGGDFIMCGTGSNITPWTARYKRYPSDKMDTGFWLSLFWYRPSADVKYPVFYIFSPVDYSKSAEINQGGHILTYYFCPLIFTIESNREFVVYEYPYDNYEAFNSNPASMFTKQYIHGMTPSTVFGQWMFFWFQALSAEQVAIYSPALDDGGFVYTSHVERSNIHLWT